MPLKRCGSVERSLQRVVAPRSAAANASTRHAEHVGPPGSIAATRGFAADDVQRRLLARSGLGQEQRPLREVERGQAQFAGDRRARIAPAQAARDHQVQHREQILVEREHDPLAKAAQAGTGRPCSAAIGGSTVRTRNGLARRTAVSVRPIVRGRSAARYSSTSGSSGTNRS